MGRETKFIRVHPEDHEWLIKETQKRVKAWEKKKEGPKPWVADIITELRKVKK